MNPLPEGTVTVIGLVILLILALILGLWAAWKRKNDRQQSDWLRRLSHILRNPWQKDDQTLQELSDQVDRLQEGEINRPPQDEPSD